MPWANSSEMGLETEFTPAASTDLDRRMTAAVDTVVSRPFTEWSTTAPGTEGVLGGSNRAPHMWPPKVPSPDAGTQRVFFVGAPASLRVRPRKPRLKASATTS